MCQGEKVTEVSQSQKKEDDLKRFEVNVCCIYVSFFVLLRNLKKFFV